MFTRVQKRLLRAIAKNGGSWESINRLARETDSDYSHTWETVHFLERVGALHIETRGRASILTINLPGEGVGQNA